MLGVCALTQQPHTHVLVHATKMLPCFRPKSNNPHSCAKDGSSTGGVHLTSTAFERDGSELDLSALRDLNIPQKTWDSVCCCSCHRMTMRKHMRSSRFT
eukprot:4456759-Amphidinium_carterae.2